MISTNDLTLYTSSKLEFIDKQSISTEFVFYGKFLFFYTLQML
jgi:hypothetical protein